MNHVATENVETLEDQRRISLLREVFPVPGKAPRCNPEGRKLCAATLDEYLNLQSFLANPPSCEGSGISPLQYKWLLAETRRSVDFCLRNQRLVHSNTINRVAKKSVSAHAELGDGRHLPEIRDEDRAGSDRRKTFGQQPVDSQASSDNQVTQFIGNWPVAHSSGLQRQIGFRITAHGKIEDISPWSGTREEFVALLRAMIAHGPYPWKIQVASDSPLAEWFSRLTGHWRAGQIAGNASLGVISEAVARVCRTMNGAAPEFQDKVLSHFLLPRARRDAGFKPWHIGAFLRLDPTFADRDEFIWDQPAFMSSKNAWSDSTIDVVPSELTLVQAKVRVWPECTIVRLGKTHHNV